MFASFRERPEVRLAAASASVLLLIGLLTRALLSNGSKQGEGEKNGKEPGEQSKDQIGQMEEEKVGINFNKEYVGLPNLGNTCYLNSLLQALSGSAHYLQFTQNIVQNKLIRLGNDQEDETCNDILYHFIVLLLQLSYHDQDADPSDLHQLICGDTRLFRIYEQCDAHELNLYIQDKLITHIPPSVRRSLTQSEALSLLESPDQATASLSSQDKLKIKHGRNPMLIQTSVALECQKCSKNECPPTFRLDSQLDINLDLPTTRYSEQAAPVSLQALIEASFAPSRIEGFKCLKCSLRGYLLRFADVTQPSDLMSQPHVRWNLESLPADQQRPMEEALDFFLKQYRHPDMDLDKFTAAVAAFKESTGNSLKHNFACVEVPVTQTRKIIKAPKLLCLHLNRLAYDQTGNVFINARRVDFPLRLELNPAKVYGFDMAVTYRLVSLIEHRGSMLGGHYVAFKRIGNPIAPSDRGKFLACNDLQTEAVSAEAVLGRTPFMLFYEQQV